MRRTRRQTLAVMAVIGSMLMAGTVGTAAPAGAAPPIGSSTTVDEMPTSPAAARRLAAIPPMGFNDWNALGCAVNEELIKQTADALISSGLFAAGYRYVNIDDCWALRERGPDGRLVPDPVKFPSGIKGCRRHQDLQRPFRTGGFRSRVQPLLGKERFGI